MQLFVFCGKIKINNQSIILEILSYNVCYTVYSFFTKGIQICGNGYYARTKFLLLCCYQIEVPQHKVRFL